jgi:hypothetical protein
MEVLYARCCGLDVHKSSITACVLIGQAGSPQSDARCAHAPRLQHPVGDRSSHPIWFRQSLGTSGHSVEVPTDLNQ